MIKKRLERDWRKWVDSNFIHVISPNVYRTFSEALDAFEWFDKAGDWANLFNTFERYSVYYLGSVIMYLLSTKLKKKLVFTKNETNLKFITSLILFLF